MESALLLPSLLLVAAYSRGGSSQHEWIQSPPAPSVTSAPFLVRLNPELEAVPPGRSVWLNCSHNCPLPVHSTLRTQLRQGKIVNGSGWVSYQLLDVRAWDSKVRCVVTCAGETREATARITAYKRPRSVILEPPVLVGHKYTLRCYVTHVFPVGFLVVSLRKGGRVVYHESLERFTGSDLANVTLTYEMRAGLNDLWQPLTCHARLNLDGLVVRSSSAPVMLTVLGEAPCNRGELVRERGCCHSKEGLQNRRGLHAWRSSDLLIPDFSLLPTALSPASIALASTSIATLVGILLAVGAVYVRKYLAVKTQL